jgi:hypothetical protein
MPGIMLTERFLLPPISCSSSIPTTHNPQLITNPNCNWAKSQKNESLLHVVKTSELFNSDSSGFYCLNSSEIAFFVACREFDRPSCGVTYRSMGETGRVRPDIDL